MVRNYTDKELLDKVKSLPSFKEIPKGRWILGVRSKADISNKYDDKFYVFDNEKFVTTYPGTTHPGLSILTNFAKYNKEGAAILKSDEWYYNVWKYGLHRGKVPGLLQLGAKVKVYRDGDKDGKAEEIGKVYEGFYGINHHTDTYNWSEANLKNQTDTIGAWSAGCQVSNDRDAFAEAMKFYKDALKTKKQEFVTYCLIKEF